MGVERHTAATVLPCPKLGARGPQEPRQVPSRALLGFPIRKASHLNPGPVATTDVAGCLPPGAKRSEPPLHFGATFSFPPSLFPVFAKWGARKRRRERPAVQMKQLA